MSHINAPAAPAPAAFGARWPLVATVTFGLLLLVLAVMAGLSYLSAQASAAALLHSAQAQRQLQSYLRGVNEVLLTEGSSASRKIVKDAGQAFGVQMATLTEDVRLEENRRDLRDVVAPGWQQLSMAVDGLLALKGVSAGDDDAMLAYGKLAARTDTVVAALEAIEARAAPAADHSAQRMRLQLAALLGVAVLFVLAVGRQVMQVMFNRLGDTPERVRAIAMRLAAHDLSGEVSRSKSARGDTLLDALADIRANLGRVVGQVHDNSSLLAEAAADLSMGNQNLSQRTEEQASALEHTAQSMAQLGLTVRQNADSAHQANQLAAGASAVAAKGGEVVGQMVETMRGIQA